MLGGIDGDKRMSTCELQSSINYTWVLRTIAGLLLNVYSSEFGSRLGHLHYSF